MRLPLTFIATALAGIAGVAQAGPFGPTPYLSFADSPFNGGSFSSFFLENFESGALGTPGVTASAGQIASGHAGCVGSATVICSSIVDSVDADDGAIDGSGLRGNSLFANGATGIAFTFNAGVLGALPTHAGIVWTDGNTISDVTFQAFDGGNNLVCNISARLGDGNFLGGTAEDRFFGCVDPSGISKIFINNLPAPGAAGSGIEVDHLQYGIAATTGVPEPATLGLLLAGLAGAAGLRRRRG